MKLIDLHGVEIDENSSPFKITFQFIDDGLFVQLSNGHADRVVEGEADDLFVDNSEFEIFEITGYNSHLSSDSDIIIEDESGQILGVLCLSCSHRSFKIEAMTTPRYLSYLVDCSSLDSFKIDQSHTFKMSYLLVKKASCREYKSKHKEKSALWGGFTHYQPELIYQNDTTTRIQAKSNISFPSSEHLAKLNEAILSNNGFDRFLKKYHLLELVYDYLYVAKLRTIDGSLNDFRDVISKYSNGDIENLKMLLKGYIDDVTPLIPLFDAAMGYEALMKNIFQDNSKSSNPLKRDEHWVSFWSRLTEFDLACRANAPKFGKNTDDDDVHRELVLDILSYWIYRIRCSIAHNKIGEFLFNSSHEGFVIEVGEPLLDMVIESIFSNQKFIDLIESSKRVDVAIAGF